MRDSGWSQLSLFFSGAFASNVVNDLVTNVELATLGHAVLACAGLSFWHSERRKTAKSAPSMPKSPDGFELKDNG